MNIKYNVHFPTDDARQKLTKGFTSLFEKVWDRGHEKQSGLSFKQHISNIPQSSKEFITNKLKEYGMVATMFK